MNIFDILKICGVEIAAENTEKFNTAFNENYVTVADFNGIKKQNETSAETIKTMSEKLKAFDGVDVAKMKKDVADWENKYNQDIACLKLDNEVNKVLFQNSARNITAVKALLKMDNVKLDNGQLLGLSEQLEALKKSDSYLFGEINNANGKHPHQKEQKDQEFSVTLEQFKNMTYLDKCKLQQENPEAFKHFSEQVKSNSGFSW